MKVHRVLEFTCTKGGTSDKVNFQCKSKNEDELPQLNGDQMNCQGSAKIRDVIEFLCYDDSLFKYIDGAPPINKKKRADDTPTKSPSDFIELFLLCEIKDENGKPKQHEILL